MKKIELLAPAGDFEKLQAAVLFGADAVYLGAQAFSLRAKAKNFDGDELQKAVEYAHTAGVKVYVTSNIFAHNADLDGAADFFSMIYETGADAAIISDPGLFDICREAAPALEIHISTQANNTNYRSAMFWHRLGAKRIVLARELSLTEISEIRKNLSDDMELEAFVHGAMCISYSGRCLLSSYMTGRDSNRGECAHPCRYEYNLVEKTRPGEYMPVHEDERGTYILNSKDLCMIGYIPEMVTSGLCSLKIEGRMKSTYYVASVVKSYREAIDDYCDDIDRYVSKIPYYFNELEKSSHRSYTTGFYFGKTDMDSQIYGSSSYVRTYDFVGVVLDYDEKTRFAVIEQRNKFSVGQELEFLRSGEENFTQMLDEIYDMEGNILASAPHPQQTLKIRVQRPLKKMDMVRTEII